MPWLNVLIVPVQKQYSDKWRNRLWAMPIWWTDSTERLNRTRHWSYSIRWKKTVSNRLCRSIFVWSKLSLRLVWVPCRSKSSHRFRSSSFSIMQFRTPWSIYGSVSSGSLILRIESNRSRVNQVRFIAQDKPSNRYLSQIMCLTMRWVWNDLMPFSLYRSLSLISPFIRSQWHGWFSCRVVQSHACRTDRWSHFDLCPQCLFAFGTDGSSSVNFLQDRQANGEDLHNDGWVITLHWSICSSLSIRSIVWVVPVCSTKQKHWSNDSNLSTHPSTQCTVRIVPFNRLKLEHLSSDTVVWRSKSEEHRPISTSVRSDEETLSRVDRSVDIGNDSACQCLCICRRDWQGIGHSLASHSVRCKEESGRHVDICQRTILCQSSSHADQEDRLTFVVEISCSRSISSAIRTNLCRTRPTLERTDRTRASIRFKLDYETLEWRWNDRISLMWTQWEAGHCMEFRGKSSNLLHWDHEESESVRWLPWVLISFSQSCLLTSHALDRATKLIALIRRCTIVVRDANRIHYFTPDGKCSCNDYF